jgi:hypothetical protein
LNSRISLDVLWEKILLGYEGCRKCRDENCYSVLLSADCCLASRFESAHVSVGRSQILVRVDWNIVDADFVMQMWTSAPASVPNIANRIPAMHVLAGEYRQTLHMPISSCDSVTMIQNHSAAVSSHEVGKYYGRVCRGDDRLSNRCSDINA